MAENVKRTVQLADGSTCEVGERQYAAISELMQAIDHVARGAALNISIVLNDGNGVTRQRLFSIEEKSSGLNYVADALYEQSKLARSIAAAWQGNVRAEARSYMEH